MAFEVFKKSSAPIPSVPSITIQKRGLISLNRAAFTLIGSPEAIEFLWDSDNQVIGLRAAPLESPDAYPTRPQSPSSDRGPVLVAGSMFTRYIGLDTTEAKRWMPTQVDNMLCIDLKTSPQPVSSNRRGTGEATPRGDEDG